MVWKAVLDLESGIGDFCIMNPVVSHSFFCFPVFVLVWRGEYI